MCPLNKVPETTRFRADGTACGSICPEAALPALALGRFALGLGSSLAALGGGAARWRIFDFDDDLDLDRDTARQRAHADGRARVSAAIAEHRDEKIRAAVDHFRLLAEFRRGVDHA